MAKIDERGKLDVQEVEVIQRVLTEVRVKLGGRQVPHGGVQIPTQDELDVPIAMLTAEDCAREMLNEEIPRLHRIGSALKQVRFQLKDMDLTGLRIR